jgi:hypothetical protein
VWRGPHIATRGCYSRSVRLNSWNNLRTAEQIFVKSYSDEVHYGLSSRCSSGHNRTAVRGTSPDDLHACLSSEVTGGEFNCRIPRPFTEVKGQFIHISQNWLFSFLSTKLVICEGKPSYLIGQVRNWYHSDTPCVHELKHGVFLCFTTTRGVRNRQRWISYWGIQLRARYTYPHEPCERRQQSAKTGFNCAGAEGGNFYKIILLNFKLRLSW